MITVPDGHGGTGLGYVDVDGDQLALYRAVFPDGTTGVNIRTTPAGCSIPDADIEDFLRAVRLTADDAKRRAVERDAT